MTDRVKGLYVALDQDIRVDDVQPIIDAICQLRHVINVTSNVANADDWMNRSRIKGEIAQKLFNILKEENG